MAQIIDVRHPTFGDRLLAVMQALFTVNAPPSGEHRLSRAEVALARARHAAEARRRVDRLLLWR